MKAETDEPLLERMRNDAARENFIICCRRLLELILEVNVSDNIILI